MHASARLGSPGPSPLVLLESLLQHGPRPLDDLLPRLGISRHAFGRLVRNDTSPVLRVGARKTARYARARSIAGIASPIPVYELGPTAAATATHLLDLIPIESAGFLAVPTDGSPSIAYADLPWFLHDHRPSGFLGRQLPRQFPELGTPDDIRRWSSTDVLRYATAVASHPPGALVVGQSPMLVARHCFVGALQAPDRNTLLPFLAERVEADLLAPAPGSSAAGAQPKLLAALTTPAGRLDIIVKYSPPLNTEVGRRTGDLFIAEHLAAETIHRHRPGWVAPTEVHMHYNRVWLFSHRFDRTPEGGRRGCSSLEAVDAEFSGVYLRRWSVAAHERMGEGLLSSEDVGKVRWLDAFGHGIGNTDMHLGNLALGLRGIAVDGVRPIYDMLPMAWMPRRGELPRVSALRPVPEDLRGLAEEAVTEFWKRLCGKERVSGAFRAVAGRMGEAGCG